MTVRKKGNDMDKDVRAVFVGAIVSMVFSCVALMNHPTECYVELGHGREAHVHIGTTLPNAERLAHD